jgi:hypothetical protein
MTPASFISGRSEEALGIQILRMRPTVVCDGDSEWVRRLISGDMIRSDHVPLHVFALGTVNVSHG